jgi:hypothetical protein
MEAIKYFLITYSIFSAACAQPQNEKIIEIARESKHICNFYKNSSNYHFDSIFADKPEYFADRIGFPVGVPDGDGYYIGKKFWDKYSNLNHLGEDWSGIGGGNSDFGDTIYAIANGWVSFSEDLGYTWGGVVGIVHQVENAISVFGDKSIVHDTITMDSAAHRYIQSFYAHCNTEMVKKGQWVKKGDPIATIGNSGGRFMAHLHLEIRPNAVGEIYSGGYAKTPDGFINPDEFRKAYNERN